NLLLLRPALFCCTLLRSRCLLPRRRFLLGRRLRFRDRFRRSSLFRLRFPLWQFRGGEFLPVKGNFGNAHGGERLPMSGDLLVLFLPFVVEDQDLVAAACADHIASYRSALGFRNLSIPCRNREHVAELNLAVLCAPLGLEAHHISWCHP